MTKPTGKILFVCLGNICRSPLAEGLMRQIQPEYALNFTLDSAGTSAYHSGEAPDPRTQHSALKKGLDLSELRARQFRASDLETFDKIFVMDHKNLLDIQIKFKTSHGLFKIGLLPHPELEGEYIEIPDPYYGSEKQFDEVFDLVSKGIHRLCRQLKSFE